MKLWDYIVLAIIWGIVFAVNFVAIFGINKKVEVVKRQLESGNYVVYNGQKFVLHFSTK